MDRGEPAKPAENMIFIKQDFRVNKDLVKLQSQESARDDLARETRNMQINKFKVDKECREKARKIKLPSVTKNIEVMRVIFERTHDKVTDMVNQLMECISEAMELSSRLNASYNVVTDMMTEKFRKDMDDFCEANKKKTVELLEKIK